MRKIAIIDDDVQSRRNMKFRVEDAGFEPILIEGKFGNDKQRLINEICEHDIYGVVSDHRLSPGQLASFYGAELLADLYDLKLPTILITQFLDRDADTTIRRYREKLPSVIGRGEGDVGLIGDLLELSKSEIDSGPNPERKPHRALIRIDDFIISKDEGVIEGVITNWKSDVIVRFPKEIIPNDVMIQMKHKDVNRLVAFVNTGANDAKDIFISDIHLAPMLEDFDELC